MLGLGINQNILEQLCEDSNDQKIFLNGYVCPFLSWTFQKMMIKKNKEVNYFINYLLLTAVLFTVNVSVGFLQLREYIYCCFTNDEVFFEMVCTFLLHDSSHTLIQAV